MTRLLQLWHDGCDGGTTNEAVPRALQKATSIEESKIMTLSINTNVGAMVALRNLSKISADLEKTQLKITTGLKVNGPKDDPSTFAIATSVRS